MNLSDCSHHFLLSSLTLEKVDRQSYLKSLTPFLKRNGPRVVYLFLGKLVLVGNWENWLKPGECRGAYCSVVRFIRRGRKHLEDGLRIREEKGKFDKDEEAWG